MINRTEMKIRVKELAQEIKKERAEFKDMQRNNENCWRAQMNLDSKCQMYRHLHIAYSMARGKEYNQIERYVRPGNEPSWYEIDKWTDTYTIEDVEESA